MTVRRNIAYALEVRGAERQVTHGLPAHGAEWAWLAGVGAVLKLTSEPRAGVLGLAVWGSIGAGIAARLADSTVSPGTVPAVNVTTGEVLD